MNGFNGLEIFFIFSLVVDFFLVGVCKTNEELMNWFYNSVLIESQLNLQPPTMDEAFLNLPFPPHSGVGQHSLHSNASAVFATIGYLISSWCRPEAGQNEVQLILRPGEDHWRLGMASGPFIAVDS